MVVVGAAVETTAAEVVIGGGRERKNSCIKMIK